MNAADLPNDEGFSAIMAVGNQTAEDGRPHVELDATGSYLNRAGTVHGGVLATLVDMAMGQALRSRSEENDVPATSQLTVTSPRPGKPGRLVIRDDRCAGRRGRRLAEGGARRTDDLPATAPLFHLL